MPPSAPLGASRMPRRKRAMLRLVALLRPYGGRLALATFFLLIGSAISLSYPQAVRYAVDVGIAERSERVVRQIALLLFGLFLIQAGLTWLRHYLMSWLGERVVADVRRRVVDHLFDLPLSWFHERRTGELVGRLAGDVAIIEGVVGTELSMALRNLVQLVGGVALLVLQDPLLASLMLAVVPPMTIALVVFGRRIRARSREVQDELGEANGRVQEALGGIATVQAFVREDHERRTYGRGVERAFSSAIGLAHWRAGFMAVSSAAGYLAIAGIVWAGSARVMSGAMTGGELTAFLLYTTVVAVALGSLTSLWGGLERAVGATERLFRILDTEREIESPTSPEPLPAGGGALRFEGVSFSYASRPDRRALDGIDLTIDAGETVALVGPSGAGKSTLASLVLRFFDPTHGSVRMEGVDLRDLALRDLRSAIALVPQDPILFSGTIAENIAYGKEGADRATIVDAAKEANAHEFIDALPERYDTRVGERGIQLSGGQRQRVAIARALVSGARILVLDEATSNLDAQSEAQVQEALDRLMRGRTTLVVAHRLSTVRRADRICVMESGRIVEQGSHESLMAEGGLYRTLVKHQLFDGGEGETGPGRPAPPSAPHASRDGGGE